jgi:hypothetical protein
VGCGIDGIWHGFTRITRPLRLLGHWALSGHAHDPMMPIPTPDTSRPCPYCPYPVWRYQASHQPPAAPPATATSSQEPGARGVRRARLGEAPPGGGARPRRPTVSRPAPPRRGGPQCRPRRLGHYILYPRSTYLFIFLGPTADRSGPQTQYACAYVS